MNVNLKDLRRRRQSGYGLLVVMSMLVVLLIVFASLLSWTTTNARITTRNNLFNQSENAADSETENILSYMMRDFSYGNLGSAATYYTNFPPTNGWPLYFQFSATNGDPNAAANVAASVYIGQQSTSATNLGSQYAGLYGFVLPTTIACTATPLGQGQNLSATICQTIEFDLIPLFQFAIFYNMDLEINPGAGMNVNGHVHSNDAIWATGSGSGASALVFSNYVEAASGVFLQRSTNDPSTARTGNVVFSISNNNPIGNANVLTMPVGANTGNNNPTNVLAILDLPPAAYAPPNFGAAYSGTGSNYLANEADLVVSNSATAANGIAILTTNGLSYTNIYVYYQDPNNSPNYLLYVQPDLMVTNSITTNGAVRMTNTFAFYSFVTNVSFYDYRESATVKAVQINVTNLDLWLANTNYFTNSLGVFQPGSYYNGLKTSGSTEVSPQSINSIYVYSSVPRTASQLAAVRVVNGSRLPPSGLTVVTPEPLYVLGNYNITTNGSQTSTILGDTANTYPAALMGDSVTILSPSWSDAYNSGTTIGSRTVSAANTTVNAATLEGIVPSNGAHYSGGVENFLRLIESWNSGNNQLTYNGSIIVLFPSQYATNFWQAPGNYYNPPDRRWGFDLNFNTASLMPPLTPKIRATIRGSWTAW
jgi:hypothetical protein